MKMKRKLCCVLMILRQVDFLVHCQRISNTTLVDGEENRRMLLETHEIRFNKFQFPKFLLSPRGFKPLTNKDYPLTGYVNETLRLSDAESVITPDDPEVVYNVPKIIDAIGGLPPFPETDENAEFWKVNSCFINLDSLYSLFLSCSRMFNTSLPYFQSSHVTRNVFQSC